MNGHNVEKDAPLTARLLILQRKCRYPGEHAPEVFAVVDEWTLDENPSWWPTEVAKHRDAVGGDADAWAEVEIDLPMSAVRAALYPSPKVPVSRVTPPGESRHQPDCAAYRANGTPLCRCVTSPAETTPPSEPRA